ncbi:MAG: ATP-dependent DNA ligase [Candidatus Bathyarchaeia archaeon]
MTLVKPPTSEEIVETYGGLREAVERLVKAGFSPDQIVRKLGLPYYLVRLLMEGFQPKDPTLFIDIVKIYDRLAQLRGRKGKETELTKFVQKKWLSLEVRLRLALGKITDENLKVGGGILEKAICLATGSSPSRVRRLLIDYGEHGEVAYLLIRPKQPKLTVEEVYEAIRILPRLRGLEERILHLSSLMEAATPDEAKYIARLILGDLKLGYHQRSVVSAVSKAYKVPFEIIERISAILGVVDGLKLAPKGETALSSVRIRPGQFIKPQLAHIYEPEKVTYPVRSELKYDGSRLQIHKWGSRIRLFSRRGIEKSKTLPEVVEIAMGFRAQSCIVDCEVIAVDDKGSFLPFQYLLTRTVPRELSEDELAERRKKVKLTIRAFDILYLNGLVLMDMPLFERRRYLKEVVPAEYVAEGRDCKEAVELMKFYEEALRRGLEGIIVKDLRSLYEPGRRTYTWLKIKPERDTIDSAIVKALYGKGRRAGFYSSFLLAVRDPKEKKLYTIGKVSNLPRDVMAKLLDLLERTKIGEDREGIFVKPSIVVEVTYQEIQETDEYTSGYALRVPKIIRFRRDKNVEGIDDLDKLRKLYKLQYERYTAKEERET